MSAAETTTDHDAVRRWAEARGTGGDAGVPRLDFDDGDGPDEGLERISREEFFATFDERGLAFLRRDETRDGSPGRLDRFVRREG